MVKNGVRMLIPFSRFTFNVRSDIANQMRVLNDPSISEAQKADARRILRGKFNEVATFGAVRTVTLQAILKGTAGIAGLLGVEEKTSKEKAVSLNWWEQLHLLKAVISKEALTNTRSRVEKLLLKSRKSEPISNSWRRSRVLVQL